MNKNALAFILITTIVVSAPLRAGVKINAEPSGITSQATAAATAPAVGPAEKKVAFITADKKYLTSTTGGVIDLSGVKIGSKQTFTIIDVNGGTLADGDEVKVRYIPNAKGVPDPSKTSYWRETPGGIKRSKEGDTFKLKTVESKYAFQTTGGKFLSGTLTDGTLSFTDKQEGALLVEIVDIQ
jgi:hypothetical protein